MEAPVTTVEPVAPTVETKAPEAVDDRAEQIKNLNTALSIERDERKKLKEELESVKPVFDKMKNVFAPEPIAPEPVAEKTEEEKFEEWYAQKESAKNAEKETEKIQELYKTQITTLATEWN